MAYGIIINYSAKSIGFRTIEGTPHGGGPTPRLSFYAVQAFFQEHCIINKTCFARIIVIDLFKYHRAGSLFANGGATSPQPPFSFKLCKATSSIILPAKTEPI